MGKGKNKQPASSLRRRVATGAGLFWVVVVVGIIFGGFFVIRGMMPSEPLESNVTFYDANGDPVIVQAGIFAGGAEVVGMGVEASWIVDASDIDPATFNAHIKVDVAIWNWDAGAYDQLESAELDSSHMLSVSDPGADWKGFVDVHLWDLVTMFQEHMTDAHKADGWRIRIRSVLTPTANDIGGNPVLPDPPTQTTTDKIVELTWVSTTALMTIVSFEQDRWLPLP